LRSSVTNVKLLNLLLHMVVTEGKTMGFKGTVKYVGVRILTNAIIERKEKDKWKLRNLIVFDLSGGMVT